MVAGIAGYGVYIPRYRIKVEDIAKAWNGRGRGERAVPHHDEDVITMAVEAAQNALVRADLDPALLDAIYFSTTSPGYLEHSSANQIAEALGCREDVEAVDIGSSPQSAIPALRAALDAVNAGRVRYGLVLTGECRPASPGSEMEQSFGAGAAAFVVSQERPVLRLEEALSYTAEFVDRWRGPGDDYTRDYDPRFTREYGYVQHVARAGKSLLAKLGRSAAEYQHVVLQEPDERSPRTVAGRLSVGREQTAVSSLYAALGDMGSSAVPVSLAAVLDRAAAGDRVLALSYGSGAATALSLVVTDEIARVRARGKPFEWYLQNKEYVDYMRYMRNMGSLVRSSVPAPMGVPPMSPQVWRERREILQLVGAKCTGCGFVNYPPSLRHICIRCGNREFTAVRLPRQGTIHTFAVAYYLPPPLEAPLPSIIADLDDGTRYKAHGTEMPEQEIKIGRRVEMVLRRVAEERGVYLYGYKFRLLEA